MNKNLLVTLADKEYINQAKQLFSSAYWKAGWKGDYMLLSFGIPEEKLLWFKKKNILVKKCPPIQSHWVGGQPPVLFGKFYLFTSFFKRWENIVYLDADIIIRASLEELTDLKNFGAVKNYPKKLKKEIYKDSKCKISLADRYDLDSSGFNAGFFAFNTNIIKEKTFYDLKNLSEKYPYIRDQGLLNIYFYKKWKELPIIYNLSPYLISHRLFFRLGFSKVRAKVIHFVGEIKPWQKRSGFYQEWRDSLEKAESIDFKKPKRGLKWNKKEIIRQSKILRLIIILYYPLRILDKIIGRISKCLKSISKT